MKKINLIAGIILIVILAASCAPAAEVAAVEALKISGLAEKSWSAEDLKALTVTEAEYTNKDGETTTYSGVSIADLLAEAGVSDFAAVSLVAADGYAVDVDKAALDACPTCIIAVDDDGALRSVMPGMEGKMQVKDLVAVEVK